MALPIWTFIIWPKVSIKLRKFWAGGLIPGPNPKRQKCHGKKALSLNSWSFEKEPSFFKDEFYNAHFFFSLSLYNNKQTIKIRHIWYYIPQKKGVYHRMILYFSMENKILRSSKSIILLFIRLSFKNIILYSNSVWWAFLWFWARLRLTVLRPKFFG